MGARKVAPDRAVALEQLEARLAALEAVVFPEGQNGTVVVPEADAERFWALRELKARTAGRSVVIFAGHVTLEGGAACEWQQAAQVDGLVEDDPDAVADVLAALGHPVRLRLLQAVLRGVHGVGELGDLEGLGTSGQLYHHLRELQAAGWLRSAGRGHYEVPPARVVALLTVMAAARR